ncbi:T cell receptor beta, partial [Clarias magur]
MNSHLTLLILTLRCLLATCLEGIQLHQDPDDLLLSKGSSLNVSCLVTGTDDPYLYWYRRTPAQGFTLMFYS